MKPISRSAIILATSRTLWRGLAQLAVCYGRVNTLPEALAPENLRARSMLLRDELGRRHVGPPIRFRAEPAAPALREPRLGEHTSDILQGKPR